MSSVPGGTCTSRSLILSEISFCSVFCSAIRVLPRADKRFGGFVRAAPAQVFLEFIAPLLDDADGRQCCSITERAERAPKHVLREIADHVDVFGTPQPGMEALEHFPEP